MSNVIILLLALAATCALAQLEPADVGSSQAPESPVSLTSLFRGQVAKQRVTEQVVASTTSQTSPVSSPTTTTTTTSQAPESTETTVNQVISSTIRPILQYVKPMTALKCYHNNQSYSIGQKWNIDCVSVCECVSSDQPNQVAISACKARCPGDNYKDPPGDNCTLLRSKLDQCCLDWFCSSDAKFAPTTTTTTVNTERGQLSMSTTEIRLPSLISQLMTTTSAPTPISPTTRATSAKQQEKKPAQQVPSIVTTTLSPPPSSSQARRAPQTTTTSPPTTITVTTSASQAPTTLAVGANRAPKQVAGERGVLATQSPSNLPAQRPHSLITTTDLPPTTVDESESRQNVVFPVADSNSEQPTDELSSVNPNEMDLCILSLDKPAYELNKSWPQEPCNQSCRCVFSSDPRDPSIDLLIMPTVNLNQPKSEPTEIRCGLPPHCNLNLAPTAECPLPKLVFPQQPLDTCACPQVTCVSPANLSQRLASSTQRAVVTPPSSVRPLEGCKSKQQVGRTLSFNETFNDECHSTCRCFDDGEIRCEQLTCPKLEPPTEVDCPEWILDPDFRPDSTENKCCPELVCARTFKSCLFMGKEIPHGHRVPEEIQPVNPECNKICICKDSKIACLPECPALSEQAPEDFNCPSELAYKGTSEDECCPKWQCEDYALQDFSVVPKNASAVEIGFRLPMFAVGRPIKAELDYTSVPYTEFSGEQPPANALWMKRSNIKTSDSLFNIQSIKYVLANLKPNHKYWFRLTVHFLEAKAPLNETLVSHLLSVVMPSDPRQTVAPSTSSTTSTTSTTTTTTTTAAPPTRMQTLRPIHYSRPPVTPSTVTPVKAVSSPSTTTTTTSQPSTTSAPTTSTTTTTTEAPHESTESSTSISSTTSTAKPVIFEIPKSIEVSPCHNKGYENNEIDNVLSRLPLPWTDHIQVQMNAPLQKYAWHLLIAFSIMTIMFTIVSYLYLKKSSRVIAPITPYPAYDNPTFKQKVTYNGYKPHVHSYVDENTQNYNNDAILAKQMQLEADHPSPMHHLNHPVSDIYHPNGSPNQRLIS